MIQHYSNAIVLQLPYPPTVNHYWLRNKNGSVRVSKRGQGYRDYVSSMWAEHAAMMGLETVRGRLSVRLKVYPPDRRKRDIDNLFKSVLDALQSAGVIYDDGDIDQLSAERLERVQGGQVLVEIMELDVAA